MSRAIDNRWLHRFALLSAFATLLLICIGGLVTSHEAGMAVPDWPTTYGYNMFFFPFSKWVGGIFYEHTHRLMASTVGFLTIILTIWLWLKDARRWMRWLGVTALFAVSLQGVLGGLRVTEIKDEIGIFHAALAQCFFVLVCAISLFTSRWWTRASSEKRDFAGLNCFFWLGTVLIFLQLVIGATMRHQHAGLAISDFPLAHHRLWPAMDPASVAYYNSERLEATAMKPITAFQIGLQMVHRMVALLILGTVLGTLFAARRRLTWKAPLTKLSFVWTLLVFSQAALGAATIWSNKSADIATAHVAVGALSFMVGSMMILVARRMGQAVPAAATISPSVTAFPSGDQQGAPA